MLDDVLYFNKFETRKIDFQPAELDLVKFCQTVTEDTRVALRATQNFMFSQAGDESLCLADTKMLRQALTNLLSNAVKYSPPDSTIYVDVDMRTDSTKISIRDTGIGIPPTAQEHLFNPFYRAPNAISVAGTGLGLVIAKEAIEWHGGSLTFVSTLGQGTIFTIGLPATIKQPSTSAATITP